MRRRYVRWDRSGRDSTVSVNVWDAWLNDTRLKSESDGGCGCGCMTVAKDHFCSQPFSSAPQMIPISFGHMRHEKHEPPQRRS